MLIPANRRLRTGAIFLLLITMFVTPSATLGDQQNFPNGVIFNCFPGIYQGAPAASCVMGIPARQVVEADYDTQHQSEWCWAASLEMALRVEGHPISQKEIVVAAYGQPYNWPATSGTIEDVANALTTDDNGNSINVVLNDIYDADPSAEIHHINGAFSRGHPVLLGLPGHVVMLTGYSYFGNGNQNQDSHFSAGRVLDPWPKTYPNSPGGVRIIDAQEFATAKFIWEVDVS
jgi:hypothetical protein